MARPKWDRTRGRPEPIRLLNQIPEHENGEPLVALAEVAPLVRMSRPTVIPYLRETVAKMLDEASRKIPEGYVMGVIDAWRPLARQQRIYDYMMRCAVEAFPDRAAPALRRTVCRWVAPTDQKAPPGHCTGAAVDVQFETPGGEVIDVWSPYSRYAAGPTFTLGLTEEALRNRMALHDAMTSVGFSNCRDEWWHYSYGDAGWAVRCGKTDCRYGLITMNPDFYQELEAQHVEAMKDRDNPFLQGRR